MGVYETLLVGPGAIFGTAAGIGYGLSIAFARAAYPENEGWAIGSVVAAFAASGIALSSLTAIVGISPYFIPTAFGIMALIYFVVSLFLWAMLRKESYKFVKRQVKPDGKQTENNRCFFCLAIAYLAFCYIGLMIMSHGVTILQELGVTKTISALAPFVLNSGYIIGALLGGVFVERVFPNFAPLIVLCIVVLCLAVLNFSSSSEFLITAVLVLGVGFGSTVSMFVTLLAIRYGTDQVGLLFGRLNVGYGLAGFTAPSLTGSLYDLFGSYELPLLVGGLLGLLGIFALVISHKMQDHTININRRTSFEANSPTNSNNVKRITGAE